MLDRIFESGSGLPAFPGRREVKRCVSPFLSKNIAPNVIRHLHYFFDVYGCEEKRWKPVHE